ncbi:calcium-binding protein [Sphingomonas lenta]|uniref:calcium-binding protein n=1 Tax=Sphingomonas lenta TaxID=1141887 RepID=UPI001140DC85|nr:calcium-binding protein [Sphingomonas lenta]
MLQAFGSRRFYNAAGAQQTYYSFDEANVPRNTYDYVENTSGIGALTGGGYVVAFIDTLPSATTVKAQIYTATGVPVGAAITVAGDVGYDQIQPDVVGLAGGGFAVSWTTEYPPSRSFDINARVFDSAGRPVGAAFTVNSSAEGFQTASHIASLAGGGLVVAWEQADDGVNGTSVRARAFDATGTAVTGEIITLAGAPDRELGDVIGLANGGFVVALTDPTAEIVDGAASAGARAFIYDAAGRPVADVAINDFAPGVQHRPNLAATADGGFAATWIGVGRPEVGVFVQRFTADGARNGEATPVLLRIAGGTPYLDSLPDGGFLLSIPDLPTFSSGEPIARAGSIFVLDSAGQVASERFAFGPPYFTGSFPPSSVGQADVAVLADGGLAFSYDVTPRFTRYQREVDTLVFRPTIRGTDGADLVGGTAGADYLVGYAGPDTLTGGDGADTLDGALGADRLTGGLGDDGYIVDQADDAIVEAPGEGYDVVQVTASAYQLAGGVSIERLYASSGFASVNIAGNSDSQVIEGNDGANILSTGGGAPDTLRGYGGDDTYRVFATGDVIEDTFGFDTVYASGTSYFLYSTAAVEYLSTAFQAGTEAFYLVGNGASQVVAGNYGDNILNGRGGDDERLPDTLIGLLGDDTYAVFTQGDVVREEVGQGQDVVYANTSYQLRQGAEVEALAAVVGSASDAGSAYTLRGNEFAQTVVGNDAATIIDGRGGNDTLIGLGGADVFAFTTAPAAGNTDTIRDFGADDRIGLVAGLFPGLAEVTTAVANDRFVVGASAQDADDRIIYDQATGRLFYDGDGNGAGAQVQFAQLAAGTQLTAAQFTIVQPITDLPGA